MRRTRLQNTCWHLALDHLDHLDRRRRGSGGLIRRKFIPGNSGGQRSSSSKVALCSAPGGFGDVWDTQSDQSVRCACIDVGADGSLESLESLESFRSDMNFLEGLDSTGSLCC